MTIIGLSGSLRRGSLNGALLRAARDLAPDDLKIEIASLRDIPLYDGDLEAEKGIPAAVQALKSRIAGAAGLLLATPEYNGSVPGVFKNAIDWLSRPPADIAKVFGDRPVAIMGATPGPGGTILAQAACRACAAPEATRPWCGPRMMVPRADAVFDAEGRLTDEALRTRVRSFLEGFSRFIGG